MRAGLAFVLIFFAFDRLAAALGSTRGEWGLVVCSVVLALTVFAERWLTGAPLAACLRALGLRVPGGRALAAGAALSLALLACLPLLARIVGAELELRNGAAWLALGMLAQGGVAEETLFRGLMYGHLRRSRTFWRAAALSAVPFAVAHLPLLYSLEPPVALLALGMAISWSFPLAWLFDRAGGSIWPGALVHATIQGGIKLLGDDIAQFQALAIAWVSLGFMAPWLLFLLREPQAQRFEAAAPGGGSG